MCEQLAESGYMERSGWDSKLRLRPLGCKSDALTTTPPLHVVSDLIFFNNISHLQLEAMCGLQRICNAGFMITVYPIFSSRPIVR